MKVHEMMEKTYAISPYARFLQKNGMKSTAVLYKNMNETMMRRSCRTIRYMLEETSAPEYFKGQVVFVGYNSKPNGLSIDENPAMRITMAGTVAFDEELYEKIPTESNYEAEIKRIILDNAKNASSMKCIMRYVNYGNHTSVDYEFVLKHGFNGYKNKVLNKLNELEDLDAIDFQNGMLDLLTGLETFVENYKTYLNSIEEKDFELNRLISALDVVPFNPPTNFYEAYVMMGVAMFLGGSFEPCRIDQLLLPFYENDETVGREEALSLIRAMFEDIEHKMKHPGTTHTTIGGSKADGSPAYNELTELCIIAVGGLRAPNVTLCMRDDMPQKLWDLFLDNIGKGYAQPAMVSDKVFVDGLVNKYNIPMEDAVTYCFGGCAEILIQGKTSCDAVWAGYDMLDVFEDTMYNNLLNCETYEEFYAIYKRYMKVTLKEMVAQNNMRETDLALHYPYPLRSLLIDSCIDKSTSYSAGGAKYNFSSAAFFGASNTFNAMYTLKKLYSGELGEYSREDFLKCFANNYKGYEDLKQNIDQIQKFGNYNEELNEIAKDLMTHAFSEIKKHRGVRGEAFYVPTMIFWKTWIEMGKCVGATPDGRVAFQPLADSVGATQGTDVEGPTSALGAALSIPQDECVGTSVFNLFLDNSNFANKEKLMKTQMLIKTYLLEGGCQVQINVVDKKLLEDALVNPEKHQNLIVRVGGFSDNFIYLSDEIKQQVIKRNSL